MSILLAKDPHVIRLIRAALREDKIKSDLTSQALWLPSNRSDATIWAKQDLVVAGSHIAKRVFHLVDSDLKVRLCEKEVVLCLRKILFHRLFCSYSC